MPLVAAAVDRVLEEAPRVSIAWSELQRHRSVLGRIAWIAHVEKADPHAGEDLGTVDIQAIETRLVLAHRPIQIAGLDRQHRRGQIDVLVIGIRAASAGQPVGPLGESLVHPLQIPRVAGLADAIDGRHHTADGEAPLQARRDVELVADQLVPRQRAMVRDEVIPLLSEKESVPQDQQTQRRRGPEQTPPAPGTQVGQDHRDSPGEDRRRMCQATGGVPPGAVPVGDDGADVDLKGEADQNQSGQAAVTAKAEHEPQKSHRGNRRPGDPAAPCAEEQEVHHGAMPLNVTLPLGERQPLAIDHAPGQQLGERQRQRGQRQKPQRARSFSPSQRGGHPEHSGPQRELPTGEEQKAAGEPRGDGSPGARALLPPVPCEQEKGHGEQRQRVIVQDDGKRVVDRPRGEPDEQRGAERDAPRPVAAHPRMGQQKPRRRPEPHGPESGDPVGQRETIGGEVRPEWSRQQERMRHEKQRQQPQRASDREGVCVVARLGNRLAVRGPQVGLHDALVVVAELEIAIEKRRPEPRPVAGRVDPLNLHQARLPQARDHHQACHAQEHGDQDEGVGDPMIRSLAGGLSRLTPVPAH